MAVRIQKICALGGAGMALLFLIAFYVFAVGTAALLLLFTWLQVQLMSQSKGGGVIPLLLIIPPIGALAILMAIRPRLPSLGYPGRGLDPQRDSEKLKNEIGRAR